MKKKNYRVTLYPNATNACKDIAIAACLSNGHPSGRLSLHDFEGMFKAELLKFPVTNEDCQCTVVGNLFTVDKRIDGKGVCLLAIEDIEIMELSCGKEEPFSFSIAEEN